MKQFNRLAKLFANSTKVVPDALVGILASDLASTQLRPESLQTVMESDAIQVKRGSLGGVNRRLLHGRDAFASSLVQLIQPFESAHHVSWKFKITRVDLAPDTVGTSVIVQTRVLFEQRSTQINSMWECLWTWPDASKLPLLQSVEAGDFEEVTGTGPGGTLFTDCTQSIFRHELQFPKQHSQGIDHWRSSIQSQYCPELYGHHGIAVGDIDGDALDDVYVCQPNGLPNNLYLQQLDGTVRDAAHEYGVDWLDASGAVLIIDIDNDHDQDLVLIINDSVMLLANDGNVLSEKQFVTLTDSPSGLAAADFDGDGDLDLYLPSYGVYGGSVSPTPYHDANNGGRNVLLRNDGEWQFTDVTEEMGLDIGSDRWSQAAAWEDYDRDGDVDLYVANDFGRNNLYQNNGCQFVDVASSAGVEDIGAGMSVSWSDYDGDGLADLYVGNMFSTAGSRISRQKAFQSDSSPLVKREFQRHARGNSLFRNVGDGSFEDVSEHAGVTRGRWAWASPFVDINNDGRDDMVVANGFLTSLGDVDL